MKAIAGEINGKYIRDILPSSFENIDLIKAAVAYANGSPALIDYSFNNQIPIDFYGRLDDSIPVSTNILSRFLKASPSFSCRLIWKYYHPKVIWLVGHGAYIGSANLTDTAWNKNIEFGVFFSQTELDENGLAKELNKFFLHLDRISFRLSEPLFKQIESQDKKFGRLTSSLSKEMDKRNSQFQEEVDIPNKFEGLSTISTKDSDDHWKEEYLTEWYETLEILKNISVKIINYRPAWVPENTSIGVHVDQFLHSYYFNKVRDGLRYPYKDFHEQNKANPDKALEEHLTWWKNLPEAPTDEEERITEDGPFLKETLKQSNLNEIDLDVFTDICHRVYAFSSHAKRVPNKVVGLKEGEYLSAEERTELVAKLVWDFRSDTGIHIMDNIKYILYGGSLEEVPRRLFEVYFDEERWVPRFGISCYGELIGWALPDKYPPRNDRSSKSLKALGYNVKIQSE